MKAYTTFLCSLLLIACIDQGPDHRLLHFIVCPLQHLTSFHSKHMPLWLVKVGKEAPSGFTLPPYLVLQKKTNDHWLLIRFGWRYDRNWPGFIFPTAAVKKVAGPMTEGY